MHECKEVRHGEMRNGNSVVYGGGWPVVPILMEDRVEAEQVGKDRCGERPRRLKALQRRLASERTVRRVQADHRDRDPCGKDDGRRIWMGWKWLNAEKYGTLGPWAGGIQTIPVALTLRDIPGAGLRLCYNPVKELQGLRDEHFHFERQAITQGGSLLSSRRIQGELLEIIARFQLDTAAEFGLQLRKGTQGHCTVGYDTAKQEVFFNPEAGPNRTSQALAPRDKVVQLHVLLDRSVVDIFGNDGLTWNCEFFKADPKSLGVELYAKGGTVQLLSLDLWKLKSR